MSEAYRLAESDLHPLALGAALLGTGGGGNPYIGMLRAREEMRRGARVEILPLEALADDDLVVSVGGIGAPVVGVEKIEQGEECLRALRAVEETQGITARALISAEIGGANAMEPVLTAAQAGLPVVDGDGMGRAFPEVQMSTFFIYGHPAAPSAIADDKGNTIVFREMVDMFWLERFARHAAVDMGAGAGFAIPPMRGDYLRRVAIPDTVTQALNIGRAIESARTKRRDITEAILAATGAIMLFSGKIIDVLRELKGGFAMGHCLIAGLGCHQGAEGRIAIQNENLVFWEDGAVKAMVPDLIMITALDTGEPITTEMLRYGQRIAVIALPAHALLRTPEALEVIGPAAFGYADIPYRPLPPHSYGDRT